MGGNLNEKGPEVSFQSNLRLGDLRTGPGEGDPTRLSSAQQSWAGGGLPIPCGRRPPPAHFFFPFQSATTGKAISVGNQHFRKIEIESEMN